MKTVAYIRVSKSDQDVNHQKLAILEFAQRQRISIDHFISVTSSSRKSKKERKIDQLLGLLEKGDSLIVSELSRIGRSVGEIITTIDTLKADRSALSSQMEKPKRSGFFSWLRGRKDEK